MSLTQTPVWTRHSVRAAVVDGRDPAATALAARVLQAGGLIVIPTDTVYGIAASVDRPNAVAQIYVAKARPLDRPIPVLISELDGLRRLTHDVDPAVERMLLATWPGALTAVLPAVDWLAPEIVGDTEHVGLRMPDDDIARAIIRQTGGALAVTSANRSGQTEARSAAEAVAALGDQVDLIVDGGPSPGGTPSTVLRFDGGNCSVLRAGALDAGELLEAFPGLSLGSP